MALPDARNPLSVHLDTLSAEAIVRLMNAEDRKVPDAVLAEADTIARGIDLIVDRLSGGGRLFYVGAGTSGRLGVLDASECPPTFGITPDRVVGIIAGGDTALREAVEGAEDDRLSGRSDLSAHAVCAGDVVVGIAASGATPYVLGAVEQARECGAATIGICCTAHAALSAVVDVAITPVVGPEVLTGSTRLKAGTATKLVLNMLSTAAMVRLGHAYGHLMVDVRPSNAKLVARARAIVSELTGLSLDESAQALSRAGDNVKVAVVRSRLGLSLDEARVALVRAGGHLRAVLDRGRPDATTNHAHLVVGVDGGATKTVAWLAGPDGSVVGRGLAGPGNPRSVGFSEAERHIDAAIAAAFVDAGLPRVTVGAAGLALAGAGRAEERDEIRVWAERLGVAPRVVVTDDAESVLAAGAPEGWGVALISGTGTLAIGRNQAGAMVRAGGWGYLLSDEGGAFWIALAALRAAMRATDGTGASTSLTSALVTRLGLAKPADFVARIYGTEMSRDQIGQLASTVFEEAAHDAVAAEIVDDAAGALATMVGSIVTRLGLAPDSYPLAVAGSVVANQDDFRARLIDKLGRACAAPRVVRVVTDPVAGAVVLARRLTSDASVMSADTTAESRR